MAEYEVDLEGIADEATGADARAGLEKLTIDELIAKHPQGVKVTGFGVQQGRDGDYYVFTTSDGYWFSGGGDVHRIAEAWTDQLTVKAINERLQAKPIRLKVWKTQTKARKTYTKAKVFELKEDTNGRTESSAAQRASGAEDGHES